MDDMRTFGRWLKGQRASLGLTQEQLADRIGYSVETIHKIEAGKRRPSRQAVELLAAELGVPPEERAVIIRWLRSSRPAATSRDDSSAVSLAPGMIAPVTGSGRSLPISPTSLIGREADVGSLRATVLQFGARLVTLVGPPGIGKTRLALAVAQVLRDEFADGLGFVELALVADAEQVVPAIMSVLGITPGAVGQPIERLVRYLRDRQMLLVLDNCEHLPALAVQVDRLLQDASGLKVLATSRAPLRVYGEKEYPVSPLPVPDVPAMMPLDQLAQYEAVRLFVERVRDIEPGFALTDENAAAVGAICARLDGLPLAIELAAARVRVFPPQALLARLGDPFELLTGGARTRPARQQTLRGAIAWSYDLLSAADKQLFRCLGVFQGGRSLEAIIAVCGEYEVGPAHQREDPAAGPGVQQDAYSRSAVAPLPDHESLDTLAGVESLTSKSLLQQREGRGGEPRFWMLETIQEYAREKLEESGEAEEVRRRHAEFFLTMADVEDELALPGPQYTAWLARLDDAQDNISVALAWSLGARTSEQKQGLALLWHVGGALGWYWMERGPINEARRWLTAALDQEAVWAATQSGGRQATQQRDKARLLQAAAIMARWQRDFPTARRLLEQSISIFRQLGDQRRTALVIYGLGMVEMERGDLEAGRALHEEGLRISRALGDPEAITRALCSLGAVAYEQGDAETARDFTRQALRSAHELQDRGIRGRALYGIAHMVGEHGEYAAAQPVWEEYLGLARTGGDMTLVGEAHAGFGLVAFGQQNYELAHAHYLAALTLLPVTSRIGDLLIELAGVEIQLARATRARQDQAALSNELTAAVERAALMLGVGEESMEAEGTALALVYGPIYEVATAAAREMLGDAAFEAARRAGRAMRLERAVSYVIESCRLH